MKMRHVTTQFLPRRQTDMKKANSHFPQLLEEYLKILKYKIS